MRGISILNEEIGYLFDQVHTSTFVIILHSNQSFEAIAAANNYPNTVPADSAPVQEEKKPQPPAIEKPAPEPMEEPKPVAPKPEEEDPLSCIKSKIQGRIYFPDIHVKMDITCPAKTS